MPTLTTATGSPNAIAFAYMLIQHKDVFPNRIITRVEVMEGFTEHKSPILFFQVGHFSASRTPPGSMLARTADSSPGKSFIRDHRLIMDQKSTPPL